MAGLQCTNTLQFRLDGSENTSRSDLFSRLCTGAPELTWQPSLAVNWLPLQLDFRASSSRFPSAGSGYTTVARCNVIPRSAGIPKGGSGPHNVQDQDEPQITTFRRPRRATAVAAALRIQGKLERAGIVHDHKAYMQSLSSAVTIAQAHGHRESSTRTTDVKRRAVRNVSERSNVEASGARQQGTAANAAVLACDPADTRHTSTSQPPTPAGDCSVWVGVTLPCTNAAVPHDRPKMSNDCNVPAARQRYQGVDQWIGQASVNRCKSVRTLAKPPAKPGAKLIPARVRPVHSVVVPNDDSTLAGSRPEEWTDAEVKRLLLTSRKVRPDTSKFWVKVAKKMPGRTVYECFDKYFEAQKTPPRPKRPAPMCTFDTKAALIGNDQSLTVAKKKKAARNLRWEVQATQNGIDASELTEKMKRQQKVDAYIDSFKRKRHAPAPQGCAGPCDNADLRGARRACSSCTDTFAGSDGTDLGVGTSEQAIAALKKMHNVEIGARLRDTPERDWYLGDSADESGSDAG